MWSRQSYSRIRDARSSKGKKRRLSNRVFAESLLSKDGNSDIFAFVLSAKKYRFASIVKRRPAFIRLKWMKKRIWENFFFHWCSDEEINFLYLYFFSKFNSDNFWVKCLPDSENYFCRFWNTYFLLGGSNLFGFTWNTFWSGKFSSPEWKDTLSESYPQLLLQNLKNRPALFTAGG